MHPFEEAIAYCIDSMLQDDARGEVLALYRHDEKLKMIKINAHDIDLKNLEQYEMLIFDGGNSSGDLWKEIFHVQQKQHFFIDENPLPKNLSQPSV